MTQTSPTDSQPNNLTREVSFRHSEQFVPILRHLNASLLVSTYAAGKVVSIGTDSSGLTLHFSNFNKAMGMAIGQDSLAIGGSECVWFLRDAGSFASAIEPAGTFDKVYLARESFITGNIHAHEMNFDDEGNLWIVNTLFSCLCTLDEQYNFVPRWSPEFITEIAAEDRCHLNGLCFENQRPAFVTALGRTNQSRGWRDDKANGGVVIDVRTHQTIASGLCMPHSPRLHSAYPGKLFVLDSGRGRLCLVDQFNGNIETIDQYPGYGRGLAITDQFAFVGMSRARETSVFGGVPICNDRDAMRCGIVVIDLKRGRSVAYLEFESGVEELFDVQIVSSAQRVGIVGPFTAEDQKPPVWVVPPPGMIPSHSILQGKYRSVARSESDRVQLRNAPKN
jgi:uncharacterized protein (TIGR03032 family)